MGRTRQPRSRRARGRLPPARPARAKRPHHRPSESDPRRHDRAASSRSCASSPACSRLTRDGRRDRVTASYRIDERARAVMLVDGRQRVQSKFRRLEGRLVWFGRVNGRRRSSRALRDPASRRRPCRESLGADACGPGPRPLRRALARAHRGRRGQAVLRAGADGCARRIAGSSRARGARGGGRCSSSARPRSQAPTCSTSRWAAVRRAPRSTSSSRSEPAARRPRRQPLGHDAPARDPRPLARHRDPGRVVLRPAARAASREDGRRRRVPRRPRADPDDPRLGPLGRRRRAADSPGNADRRGDRGDLRGVRGRRRQAALGRQDADVHAPPRAPRRALPRRPVRPPDP